VKHSADGRYNYQRRETMGTQNLQEEIKNLEKTKNIKILGIETLDGVLTPSVVRTAIDSLKDTLEQIDLDEIADVVDNNIKAFAGNV